MDLDQRDFVSLPLKCEDELAQERARQKPFLRPSIVISLLVIVVAALAYGFAGW